MLNQKEKAEIRRVLEEEQRRLARTSQNALAYSMNHERNIGRDSIDESMEEEIFSTEMRLHDREKFLLGKVTKQLLRLEAMLCALLSLHAHRADDRTPISATSSRVSGKWHAVSVPLPLSSSSGSFSLHSSCALGQRV